MPLHRIRRVSMVVIVIAVLTVGLIGGYAVRDNRAHRREVCVQLNEIRAASDAIIAGAVAAGAFSNDPEYARRFEIVARTVRESLIPRTC